jgi:hypothetical protein
VRLSSERVKRVKTGPDAVGLPDPLCRPNSQIARVLLRK